MCAFWQKESDFIDLVSVHCFPLSLINLVSVFPFTSIEFVSGVGVLIHSVSVLSIYCWELVLLPSLSNHYVLACHVTMSHGLHSKELMKGIKIFLRSFEYFIHTKLVINSMLECSVMSCNNESEITFYKRNHGFAQEKSVLTNFCLISFLPLCHCTIFTMSSLLCPNVLSCHVTTMFSWIASHMLMEDIETSHK